MKPYSRIHATIDLDAITHNLEVMEQHLKPGVPICAVIKADGYGHGAAPIARFIEKRERIWGFAVATAEEGFSLRRAGIRKPILMLGYAFPESYEELIREEIRLCIFDREAAELLSQAAATVGMEALLHIAVDTGMSRIGFQVTRAAAAEVKAITELPGLVAEGLFTHFARCDERSLSPAKEQLDRYRTFESYLEEEGVTIPLHHVCNSAGIMRYQEANRDLVRAGITLYGLTPSEEIAEEMAGLKPVMSLTSQLACVKTLPAGRAVSYGGTYVTSRETRVATVPVGYADGYPRLLSGRGEVLIRGHRAPILGRICMDQFMVDVTHIPAASREDEVVLLGRQGGEQITAEELGRISGRFNYELVCDITKRVPRNYLAGGGLVEQVDYFK